MVFSLIIFSFGLKVLSDPEDGIWTPSQSSPLMHLTCKHCSQIAPQVSA